MLKRFVSYYRPHIGLLIVDMVAALAVSLCNLYYPTLAKNIINDYALRESYAPIIMGAVILLVIYLIKAVGNYIIGKFLVFKKKDNK